jgi:hypothetical protein
MATDDKKSGDEPRKRGQVADKGKAAPKAGAKVAEPKRGLNKIPGWLRHDLGWHDWIASSVVIIGGGLALTLLVWILSVVWPG